MLLDLGTHNTGYTDSYPWNTAFRPYEFPLRLMVDPAFRSELPGRSAEAADDGESVHRLSLAGDPMVACLVLFNEQSINIHASRLSADTTGPVNEILGPGWQAYLEKRYGTMQNLRAAWKDVELPADAGFGTLPPLTGPNFVRGEMGRDMARFFLEVQQETTGFLQSVVAESGYRGLTTHWDWQQYQYMTPLRGMMPSFRITATGRIRINGSAGDRRSSRSARSGRRRISSGRWRSPASSTVPIWFRSTVTPSGTVSVMSRDCWFRLLRRFRGGAASPSPISR